MLPMLSSHSTRTPYMSQHLHCIVGPKFPGSRQLQHSEDTTYCSCCTVRHAAKCSNGRLTGMWRSWLVQQASSDEWVAAGSCQVMPCQAAGSWPQLALADRSHAGGGPPRNIDLVIHLHAGAPGHGPQTTLHSVASANKSRKSYSPELSNRNHSNLSKKWE